MNQKLQADNAIPPVLDETHNKDALSWLTTANSADTDFPIQNLPFGVFSHSGTSRIGIAIGDQILDLGLAFDDGLLPDALSYEAASREPSLNALMSFGSVAARSLRKAAFKLLSTGNELENRARRSLVPMATTTMLLPAQIGDFTDFFTSIHHATRGSQIARPGTPPLFPNFKHLPIAYHGRASSVVVSGTPCFRPNGQLGSPPTPKTPPPFGPTQKLDFELELAFYVGAGNSPGTPIDLDCVDDHVFGFCLVNDWSARDIQRWESQPLGPFLAKSFMTSASPWVITLDAIAPFRVPAANRGEDAPDLSAHLDSKGDRLFGGIDVDLQVALQSSEMRARGTPPVTITSANFANQYWTLFQMLVHHASNGCALKSGDLLSSGTVSDPEKSKAGCLLELTQDGTEPLSLTASEDRTYLEDGDEVSFHGRCSRDGYRSIGFGTCQGRIVP